MKYQFPDKITLCTKMWLAECLLFLISSLLNQFYSFLIILCSSYNLIDSMPKRLKYVIERGGRACHW